MYICNVFIHVYLKRYIYIYIHIHIHIYICLIRMKPQKLWSLETPRFKGGALMGTTNKSNAPGDSMMG